MVEKGEVSIVGPEETGIAVSIDGLPKDALRAIIAKLNEKSQRSTIASNGRRFVNLDQLKQLISKVDQEFEGCRILSRSVSVRLILTNKRRYDFNSWLELEEFDRSIIDRTRSLSMEATFDVFRGEITAPERYSVQVTISNSTSNRFFIPANEEGLPDFDGVFNQNNISASVQYKSYILGKNILSTVQSWIDNLDRQAENPWLSPKNSSNISFILIAMSLISGFGFCAVLPDLLPTSGDRFRDMFYWLLSSVVLVFLFTSFGIYVGSTVEGSIDSRAKPSSIRLTEGDAKHDRELSRTNRSLLLRALVYVGVVAVEVGISAAVVWTFSELFLS